MGLGGRLQGDGHGDQAEHQRTGPDGSGHSRLPAAGHTSMRQARQDHTWAAIRPVAVSQSARIAFRSLTSLRSSNVAEARPGSFTGLP